MVSEDCLDIHYVAQSHVDDFLVRFNHNEAWPMKRGKLEAESDSFKNRHSCGFVGNGLSRLGSRCQVSALVDHQAVSLRSIATGRAPNSS